MKIKFNMDDGKTPSGPFIGALKKLIVKNLTIYSYRIVTLEVNLSEENGEQDDKRCVLSVGFKGFESITVTHRAETHALAVQGATDKLNEAMHDLFSRSQN